MWDFKLSRGNIVFYSLLRAISFQVEVMMASYFVFNGQRWNWRCWIDKDEIEGSLKESQLLPRSCMACCLFVVATLSFSRQTRCWDLAGKMNTESKIPRARVHWEERKLVRNIGPAGSVESLQVHRARAKIICFIILFACRIPSTLFNGRWPNSHFSAVYYCSWIEVMLLVSGNFPKHYSPVQLFLLILDNYYKLIFAVDQAS